MAKLWGGRFSKKGMASSVMKFTSSLEVDKILAEYDCLSSKVHVEMLAKCGYVSLQEKEQLLSALDEFFQKIKEKKFFFKEYEDIHSLVQDFVEKKFPQAAKKMHTARSRNEQVVNDTRLYCKHNIEHVKKLVEAFQKSLITLAERSIDVILPGYTHLNHAQPVLFSHLVMAYVEMMSRDTDRLENALSRCDISVMGSGALAGSSLEIDSKFSAEKLGFKKISANSIDAVSDRDFIAEFIAALCFIAVHLSRICEDFILYSIPEFGFLDIGEEYCTGSSLMPQKKNPDVLELIRGKTGQVISALNALFILLKAQPHSYNRDLQEDKKPLFESVKIVSEELVILTGIVNTITVKKDAALKALEDEFIYATDLAEYLVRKQTAFKDAHNIVGNIVKHCIAKGKKISSLSITELKKFSQKIDKDIYGLLNPEVSVKNKKTIGSTNPDMVKNEIARWKRKLM